MDNLHGLEVWRQAASVSIFISRFPEIATDPIIQALFSTRTQLQATCTDAGRKGRACPKLAQG